MESTAYSGAGCPFDTMEPSVETHRGSLVEPFFKQCHPKSSLNLDRYNMYEFGINKFHVSFLSTVLHVTSSATQTFCRHGDPPNVRLRTVDFAKSSVGRVK